MDIMVYAAGVLASVLGLLLFVIGGVYAVMTRRGLRGRITGLAALVLGGLILWALYM
jgi:hypothetical protein